MTKKILNKARNAYGYIRVSTQGQADEGASLEVQEKLIYEWARDNNFNVIKIFADEGVSAKTDNRPQLKEMLEAITLNDDNVEAIIVIDTSRFARNELDHFKLKAYLTACRVKLIAITQPFLDSSPEGKLMDTVLAGMNAFHSNITGKKTAATMLKKAEYGWPPFNAPFGYKNVENPTPTSKLDTRIVAIDEKTAPYVVQLYKMYATGNFSYEDLALYLEAKGISAPKGGKARNGHIGRILTNVYYTGSFQWQGKIFNGKYKPIISKALFEKVKKNIAVRNQFACRQRKHEFLLKGLLYFEETQARAYAGWHTGRNGKVAHYYDSEKPKGNYIKVEVLEKQVEKFFSKIQISSSYKEYMLQVAKNILTESNTDTDSRKRSLLREKTKLEYALRNVHDARFVENTITTENFQELNQRYSSKIRDVDSQLSQISTDHSHMLYELDKLLCIAESIGKLYREGNFTDKKMYLGLFLERLWIKDGKITKFELKPEVKDLIKCKDISTQVSVSWGGRPGSNRRHPPPQGGALPLNYGHQDH